jgi:hypothetical protein
VDRLAPHDRHRRRLRRHRGGDPAGHRASQPRVPARLRRHAFATPCSASSPAIWRPSTGPR